MPLMRSARAVSADDRAAITALCTEYVFRIDNGFADTVPELFADDATWDGPHGALRGRADLDRLWTERAKRRVRTRHSISNVRLAWDADDRLHGWITFTLCRAEADETPRPTPSLVAEHIDTYAFDAKRGWLFQTRAVSMAFYDETWDAYAAKAAE